MMIKNKSVFKHFVLAIVRQTYFFMVTKFIVHWQYTLVGQKSILF